MANNPYVNRVQLADGTSLIDISDTTATADKILSGYTAYGADGSKLTGTATGGGSVTQDQNGFIVLPPDGGGSPSVGGLEYETGTWTPSEDISRGTIAFTNTHTVPPLFIMLTDDTQTTAPSNSNRAFSYNDHYRQVGHVIGNRYGYVAYMYATSDTGGTSSGTQIFSFSSDSDGDSTGTYSKYYAKATEFYPSSNSASRYWRAGRTYKWIAVWKPTT